MSRALNISLKKRYETASGTIMLDEVCSVYDMQAHHYIQTGIEIETGQVRVLASIDAAVLINQKFPDCNITSMGSEVCVITFIKPATLWSVLKTVLLCIVLFFGGAIGIISFNEDVEMKAVHTKINTFFTGQEQESAPYVSIPYSIGIFAGFVGVLGIFRNRKGKKPGLLELDIDEFEEKLEKYFDGKMK
jgi:stage V sporulation protein AA